LDIGEDGSAPTFSSAVSHQDPRLLHMTTSAPTPLPIRPHQVAVPPEQRHHRREVVRWALIKGLPLHRDALAAIIDAHAVRHGGGSQNRAGAPVALKWTRLDVEIAIQLGAPGGWCSLVGAEPPAEISTTLATYLSYLSRNRIFSPDSDSLGALRSTISEWAGEPSATRGRRRHPSSVGSVLALRSMK